MIDYFLKLMNGEGTIDDIDHLGNRRLRSVGELLQNQFRIGLARGTGCQERMTIQDVDAITRQALINIRPVVAAVKVLRQQSVISIYGPNQPSGGIDHKRRLSALGPGDWPGGAGFEVRDVHHSTTEEWPIETPDSQHRSDRILKYLCQGKQIRFYRDTLPKGRQRKGNSY